MFDGIIFVQGMVIEILADFDTQELMDEYKQGAYEDRYSKAVAKANRLTTLLQGWVAYAKELSEARLLQVCMHVCMHVLSHAYKRIHVCAARVHPGISMRCT